MGRPERPVDPEAGPVQRLAHELRELRAACGGPSYRVMARRAHYSAATLAQAAGGERLPSRAVVAAYARACGADPGEWEARWKSAAEEDLAARQSAGGGGADEPPYRGLVRFEPGDEELFFGRDRLVGELLELVAENRLAMVFGASGSGKSSLLRAGLIPRLRRRVEEEGCAAVLRVLTPGATPAATHGRLLAPADGEPDSWVIVDQFEEVFTLCRDPAERARFIDLLLAARDRKNRLRVVIAVRADFYARCAEHRGLVDAVRGAHLLVGPMDATELREAVVRPAAAAGLLVERELTARIIDEVVDRPGALPMLSHALLETWHRRHGRTLTTAAYEAAGGVQGAIAATAERLYGNLSAAQARTVRRVLLRLIEPGQGTTDTRRPVRRGELEPSDPELCEVVERLTRARLLTVDAHRVELAHEALINCWPRLRSWVEEDRERLRHHRRLTQAAHTWEEHGRDTGTLYRGTRLAHAEELFSSGVSPELNTLERDFLTSALDARAHEHRTATRTARRARRLTVSLSVAVTLSLVTALAAWKLHSNGEREHTDTAARRIASVAASMRTTDPRTAMLLSVAAWRTAPLPESRSALLGALTQPQVDAFTAPGADGDSPRFLADSGRTVLSTEGRTWRTWNVATHRRTASGRLPYGTVLAAGPDARVLVLQVPGGQRLWDVTAGRWTGPARALPSSYTLDFGASDGGYVRSDPEHGRTELRSVTNNRLLYGTSGTEEPDLAPSPDDRRVAVCRAGHAPAVLDLADHRTLHGGWESARDLCDDPDRLLRFGPGDRLTALSGNGIRAWDTGTGRQLADIYYPDVQYAALSADGRFLAASCRDEIRIWRLSTAALRYSAPVFRYPLGGQLPSAPLAWDPRRPVLRYLEGSTVHTLDVAAPLTLRWHQQPLDGTLLSPDGRTLATARRTGRHYRFQLRDTADGRLLRTLRPPPFPVAVDGSAPVVPRDTMALMAFSPDSEAFAYGVSTPGRDAAPQRLTVWDVTADRERTTLDITSSAAGTALGLALGPGGRTLLAARTPGTPRITDEVWDVARHRRKAVLRGFDSHLLAVRPDGRLLVGSGHSAALPTGPVRARALGQSGQIGALTFGADGSLLAAGDLTGRVALWDGDLHRRAGILPNVFPGPALDTPEAVTALAVSPDGRTLAVAGDAGTVQLWDTATRQPLGGALPTPGEGIRSLAFSPDSGTLYVAGAYVPLQRYAVSVSAALTQVCARAGTTLTRAQWRAAIPDAPYRNTCEQR
ncbi:WD40 repeat domain-containing protein [Streptomyces sp. NPDC002276]